MKDPLSPQKQNETAIAQEGGIIGAMVQYSNFKAAMPNTLNRTLGIDANDAVADLRFLF